MTTRGSPPSRSSRSVRSTGPISTASAYSSRKVRASTASREGRSSSGSISASTTSRSIGTPTRITALDPSAGTMRASSGSPVAGLLIAPMTPPSVRPTSSALAKVSGRTRMVRWPTAAAGMSSRWINCSATGSRASGTERISVLVARSADTSISRSGRSTAPSTSWRTRTSSTSRSMAATDSARACSRVKNFSVVPGSEGRTSRSSRTRSIRSKASIGPATTSRRVAGSALTRIDARRSPAASMSAPSEASRRRTSATSAASTLTTS